MRVRVGRLGTHRRPLLAIGGRVATVAYGLFIDLPIQCTGIDQT